MPMHQSTKTIRTVWIFTTIALVFFALAAHADRAKFGDVKFSDNDNGDSPTTLFSTDTAEIFLRAELVDMVGGETLTATWIAENVDDTPPNYKIDSADVTAKESMTDANFSLRKPSTGWHVGDYRVDMAINGNPAGIARFKIAKP